MTERPSLTDEQPMPDWAELWMAINGAGAESAEKQANQFMASMLEGMTIQAGVNSGIVHSALVNQFKFAEARAALALRAERAKPTQSDDEWVDQAMHKHGESPWGWLPRDIKARLASIRAEGSAERALEWASGWHRVAETMCVISGVSPALGADEMATAFRDAWENASAERAKLEAALRPFAEYAERYNDIPGVLLIHDNVELWQDGHDVKISVGDLRRARAARAGVTFVPTPLPHLAQPAESGETKHDPSLCDYGYANCEICFPEPGAKP